MSKRNRDKVLDRRRAKKDIEGKPKVKEKFMHSPKDRDPLVPLNNKQKDYINAIHASSCVIAIGVWGSSKSYIPAIIASDMLMDKKIERIIISRPNEGKGKTIGLLPGDKNAKLEVWSAPITDTMRKRMGGGHFDAMLANGRIELLSLETVKGRSWDDAMIIVDEAEDLDPEVAKSLVGRQGMNSTTVITGDIAQQDLKRSSGLQYLLDVSEFANLNIPVINFDSWDYCVRSEDSKMWGMAFEAFDRNNGRKNEEMD